MQQTNYLKQTQYVFIASKFFNSFLGAMFGLLSFILCKQCDATPLQVTLLVSSKPMVALASFYGFLFIKNRPERLKTLILASTFLSFLPCFFFPFFENNWFCIFSFALFMMSARAMIPAWTEIFKLNIDPEKRGMVFSQGSTINYLSNIALPLLIAPIMDYYPPSWKWIFFILAFIQLFDLIILAKLPVNFLNCKVESQPAEYNGRTLSSLLIEPWKNTWHLMKERADFRNYQIVFMLGGTGLILAHPILPLFFNQVLHLSYTQLALAVSVCKGIGFALTSPIWAKWFNRISIHFFNFYVTAFAGLFALIIVTLNEHLFWIYLAYLIYGIMQAGSELSWNLAGPKFAREQDSTLFTSVNVAMVGLRGCIAPFLGELLFLATNFTTVFVCSACFCFMGSFYSFFLDRKAARQSLDRIVNI